MSGWPVRPLAECCEIISGATPSTSVKEYWGGCIRWATPKDLSELGGRQSIEKTARRITDAGLRSCATRVLPAQSVLLSSRAPIGLVAINTVPMATNQGFKSLIPRREVLDAKYLFHWLRANRTYLDSLGNGATFKEVSKATVSRVEIPLPPLTEQCRIAAILDLADSLTAKRRAALEALQRLPAALFREMFGDPAAGATKWPTVRVSDIVAKFESGKNLVADEEDEGGAYRVLKVSSVTSGTFRAAECKPLPRDYQPPPTHLIRKGDLLFSRANTTELIGATALVDQSFGNLVLPDKLWRFVLHDPPRAELRYVQWLFRHGSIRAEVARRSTGTSGSMKNISQEKVLSIEVGLPPLELQATFAARVSEIDSVLRTQRLGLEKSSGLQMSLQHRAFQGAL